VHSIIDSVNQVASCEGSLTNYAFNSNLYSYTLFIYTILFSIPSYFMHIILASEQGEHFIMVILIINDDEIRCGNVYLSK